jgi:CheY-like chemotaxis protein
VPAERRVLVVEDEDVLRTLLCRVLERAGCTVAGARDGDEALRVFDEADGFDAAVLDVGVPPAGAAVTLRALRARRPDLAAVLISGSGPDDEVRALLREGRSAFLGKPFAPQELARALASLGAGPPG